ncbi:MAG: ABC transporter ATP-binding protein [Chloroflexi bacterium]|nr:MAG: ABC transporter ATP-binding protein [Chloroflexota bacterium]
MTDATAIETRELAKRYKETIALAGLTMTVPRGEVFGFLGPNGAGKTTAVKLLLGLARPTGGQGVVLGAPLGDLAARRRIGYLPELFRYQSWLRAREVLAAHCELAGVPSDRWAGQISSVLELVGLTDRAGDRVGSFSKGMQQRLGIAVALLGDPEVVFLDEPTSALDPVGRADVRALIHHLREHGVTVFLNSHLLGEVERVCDRVAIVDRGRVIVEGRIDELLGSRSVRIRVTEFDGKAEASLGRFGPLTIEGDWLTIRPVEAESVPDIVATIVAGGGRVHAVEPGRATLEDRFLALLQIEEALEAAKS